MNRHATSFDTNVACYSDTQIGSKQGIRFWPWFVRRVQCDEEVFVGMGIHTILSLHAEQASEIRIGQWPEGWMLLL